jgi:hypothetical protein
MFLHVTSNPSNLSSNWARQRRYSAHKLGGREIVSVVAASDGDAGLVVNTIQNHVGRPAGSKDYAFVEAGAFSATAVASLKRAGVNIVRAVGDNEFETVTD